MACRSLQRHLEHSNYVIVFCIRKYMLILLRSIVINETVTNNDVARFHQVRQSITNAFAQRASPSKAAAARSNGSVVQPPLPSPSAASTSPYGTTGFPGQRAYGQVSANGIPTSPYGAGMYGFSFKPSPFYNIEGAVSGLRTCEGK
jgi:E3 SUMO-protein ligase PIAS1